jgi:hypothetical protein
MREVGQLLKPAGRSCDGANQSEREGILDLKASRTEWVTFADIENRLN